MDPQEFLTALWGERPPGVALLWTLPQRESAWYTSFETVNRYTAHHTDRDIYTGVGLASRDRGQFDRRTRFTEAEVAGIAGLWADIDWQHPAHKKSRLPPDRAATQATLEQALLEPTLLVNSGHGLQAWWLFETPWLFQDPAEHELGRRAAQWWHRHLQELYAERGWTVDPVFNLDRVMRLPGTWNHRAPGESTAVSVIEDAGKRYAPREILDRIPADFQTTPAPAGNRSRQRRPGGQPRTETGAEPGGQFSLDPNAEPSLLRIEPLLKNNPKFRLSWEGQRNDLADDSPSGYDMSLAAIALQAGWPEQEVVNLLICWRRKHGHDLKLRESYYASTIANARRVISRVQTRNRAQEQLQETIARPQPSAAAREELKDSLSQLLGVDIVRIVKYEGDPPVFYLQTRHGGVTLGKVERITHQHSFRSAVASATHVLIPRVSPAVWDQRAQAILHACEILEVGDASYPDRETRTWLREYLLEKPPREEADWEKAAETKRPFRRNGATHIFLDDFRLWLEVTTGEQLTAHALGRRLRLCEAGTEQVNLRIGDYRTTRTCWRLPSGEDLEGTPENGEPDPAGPESEPPPPRARRGRRVPDAQDPGQ